MFSSKKSLKSPSGRSDASRLLGKSKSKLTGAIKQTVDTKWLDEDNLLNNASRFTYTAMLFQIAQAALAVGEFFLDFHVPFEVWVTVTVVNTFFIICSNSMWFASICNASVRHGDSFVQTLMQLVRNTLYGINVFFLFVYVIQGNIAIFLVHYARHDLKIVSSLTDQTFDTPSPFSVQILFMFLAWVVLSGVLSFAGLFIYMLLNQGDFRRARFEGSV